MKTGKQIVEEYEEDNISLKISLGKEVFQTLPERIDEEFEHRTINQKTESEIIKLALDSCIRANGGVREWNVCYTGHQLAEINSYITGYYDAMQRQLDFEVVCDNFTGTGTGTGTGIIRAVSLDL